MMFLSLFWSCLVSRSRSSSLSNDGTRSACLVSRGEAGGWLSSGVSRPAGGACERWFMPKLGSAATGPLRSLSAREPTASEVVQSIKGLSGKFDDLSLVARTDIKAEGKS